MDTTLSNSVAKLAQIESVRVNLDVANNIRDLNRYFSQDEIKAYLLGQLLNDRSMTSLFKDPEMKRFLSQIEDMGLMDYFKGNKRAILKNDRSINWLILGFGLLVTFLCAFRFFNSFSQVVFSNRYGIMSVNEGGYPLILGIGLIITFFVRHHYSN